MTTVPIVPMSLGDIFDRLFKLIGKTWIRNLILACVILIVPVLILTVGMNAFFSSIAALAKENEPGEHLAPHQLFAMLGSMGWFFLGLFLFLLASAASTLSITIVSCAEMSGEPMTWQEALDRTFGIRLARQIGVSVIQAVAFSGLILVPYVMLIVAIAMRSTMLGLLGGCLLLACIPIVVFLFIRWAFTTPALGWESLGVFASFRRSWGLVTNNWWRVFGILLLMSIIVSFATSLVMTPVYLITLWKFFASYFEMIGSQGSELRDPSVFLEGLHSFALGIGIVAGLSSVLQMLVTPLYHVVLYFDLRARNNEFSQPSPLGTQPLA
ncbi:MAG TPA: hypothetical protein VI758_01420 [Bacteroidota bacterium]